MSQRRGPHWRTPEQKALKNCIVKIKTLLSSSRERNSNIHLGIMLLPYIHLLFFKVLLWQFYKLILTPFLHLNFLLVHPHTFRTVWSWTYWVLHKIRYSRGLSEPDPAAIQQIPLRSGQACCVLLLVQGPTLFKFPLNQESSPLFRNTLSLWTNGP